MVDCTAYHGDDGWRWDIHADMATRQGLQADDSFQDNIRAYLEGTKPAG